MGSPLDLSKFRTSLTKNIKGISTGFNDPVYWISTGNYCLNYLISGAFDRGVPLGKMTVFAGESGSGKSYISSGNIVKNAQEMDVFAVVIDTENALDEAWLQQLGVDTDPSKIMRVGASMVDDVAKILSNFMSQYVDEYGGLDYTEKPKILFVIDSLGMLLTNAEHDQFQLGDMKGDRGLKAKALTTLVRNAVNLIANHPVGIVATNHTYASQSIYEVDDIISGGNGPIFASSIIVSMQKKKLKESDDGKTITDVTGIRANCKVVKTRYAKPFESVEIKIPYSSGMSAYSGLVELLRKMKVFEESTMKLTYTTREGVVYTHFKSHWEREHDSLEAVLEDLPYRKKELEEKEIAEQDAKDRGEISAGIDPSDAVTEICEKPPQD